MKARRRRVIAIVAGASVLTVAALVGGENEERASHKPHRADLSLAAAASIKPTRSLEAYPAQTSLFKAFREPLSPPSSALLAGAAQTAELVSAEPDSTEPEPGLLRTVYASASVTTGLFPTNSGVCFVAVISGVSSSTCNSTANASAGIGLLLHNNGEYHLAGVLPEEATEATIEEAGGAAVEAPLNPDRGYAVTTKAEPAKLVVTNSNGSVTRASVGEHGASTTAAGRPR